MRATGVTAGVGGRSGPKRPWTPGSGAHTLSGAGHQCRVVAGSYSVAIPWLGGHEPRGLVNVQQ